MGNFLSSFNALKYWNQFDEFDSPDDQREFQENPQLYFNSIKEGFKRKKTVSDARFDQVFDQKIKKVSSMHWTSVEVSLSILELLDLNEESKVLDVGSGSGKFCLIGALNSKACFTGVEQRQNLVKLANQLVSDFRINNVSFVFGNAVKLDWSSFDVIYLFNPYYENILPAGLRIDLDIKVSHKKYKNYITATQNKLSQLNIGTRIVTYYGFGDVLPDEYKMISSVEAGASQIEVWIKVK